MSAPNPKTVPGDLPRNGADFHDVAFMAAQLAAGLVQIHGGGSEVNGVIADRAVSIALDISDRCRVLAYGGTPATGIGVLMLIASAIATQEGDFNPDPSVTPQERANPGDLRYANQKNATAPGWDGKPPAPIATFVATGKASALQNGTIALLRDILAKAAEGMTLRELLTVDAPSNENDTAVYIANVEAWTGLPLDVPVAQLIEPLASLSAAGQPAAAAQPVTE
jgi:hypothetical protein